MRTEIEKNNQEGETIELTTLDSSINSVQPASSFTIKETSGSIIATHSTEVAIPKAYTEESWITIRMGELDKARNLLLKAQEDPERLPFGDICLAIATTLIGVFLTSLFSGIQLAGPQGVFSYCFCPALSIAFFAIFLQQRHESKLSTRMLAERVLDYLVDPSSEESSSDER